MLVNIYEGAEVTTVSLVSPFLELTGKGCTLPRAVSAFHTLLLIRGGVAMVSIGKGGGGVIGGAGILLEVADATEVRLGVERGLTSGRFTTRGPFSSEVRLLAGGVSSAESLMVRAGGRGLLTSRYRGEGRVGRPIL
jgi:hypothetical protein